MSTFLVMGDPETLPATGAMGGAPMPQNIKRAILRSPPKVFTVKVLDPVKHGGAFSYGLRVTPVAVEFDDDRSSRSSRTSGSAGSMKEYEVWRRWEDCLWFQELIEEEYAHMARLKRQRLAAGKGVKKNGVYKHPDQAASFESLPPGPEVNSVAKDIHDIIPKLSKKGTIFRPSQAIIDQRGKEFRAMIEALFEEDVPTLLKELRDSRIIRDFFGYWRRDKDRERKTNEKSDKSVRGSRASVASSAFSMYFSASNISLQLPNSAYPDLPPSPSLQQHHRPDRDVSSSVPRTEYSHSPSSPTPNTAPASLTFTVNKHGSLASAALDDSDARSSVSTLHPRSVNRRPRAISLDTHLQNIPSDADESDMDSMIDFLPECDDWPQTAVPQRSNMLAVLPEEEELGMSETTTPLEELPPPTPRRGRDDSFSKRESHRNGMIFVPTSQEPNIVDLDDMLNANGLHPHADIDAIVDKATEQISPHSSSSHSSAGLSDRSSWRTSVASMTSFAPSTFSMDYIDDAINEIEEALAEGGRQTKEGRAPRLSVATMNSVLSGSSVDAVLPKRLMRPTPAGLRRSLSAGSQRRVAPLSIPTEEAGYEQQEELIDAYFYDPALRSTEGRLPEEIEEHSQEFSQELEIHPQTPGRERVSQSITQSLSTPEHYPKPFQNRPPGQFHLPWTPEPLSPTSSITSTAANASPSKEMFTVKAILADTAVLIRATYTMSLYDIRQKISEKFASQERIVLPSTFIVAITSAASNAPRGRPRSNSTSAVGLVNSSGLRYITTEFEWQELVSICPGKLSIRILN